MKSGTAKSEHRKTVSVDSRPSDNFIELTAYESLYREEGRASFAPCYVDVLSILAILPLFAVAGSVLYMQWSKEIFVKESPAEVQAKIEAHWKGVANDID